jgi:DNA-binding ferritin-like protein
MYKTQEKLLQVFNDNFMAYWRSHVAHVNVIGRTFSSDHALLGGIYEELQDQIDIIAELLRSLGEFMPNQLALVMDSSEIADAPVEGSSDDFLATVRDNLVSLEAGYRELIEIADQEGHEEIANYAQDRVLSLAKHLWMLTSTLA